MRYEELNVNELTVNSIIGSGAPGIPTHGEKFYLNAALGSDGNDGSAKRPLKTLASAYQLMTSNNNDQLYIYPSTSSISLAANLAITKNMCSFIGTHWAQKFNIRSRIGMSTAFTPMITVSGYGNTFANLYTMHGTAEGDYMGWYITGSRNGFVNCHFGGPMNAAQGGHASYEGISISGSENYFKDCVIGTDTIGRDEVTPNVTLEAGSTNNVFENCIFMCMLTDGDPVFITVENTTTTTAHFKGCTFIAFSSNWAVAMTKAFHFTAGATAGMYFDSNCNFVNVSALSAADKDQFIWLPRQFVTTIDTEGMRSAQLTI